MENSKQKISFITVNYYFPYLAVGDEEIICKLCPEQDQCKEKEKIDKKCIVWCG